MATEQPPSLIGDGSKTRKIQPSQAIEHYHHGTLPVVELKETGNIQLGFFSGNEKRYVELDKTGHVVTAENTFRDLPEEMEIQLVKDAVAAVRQSFPAYSSEEVVRNLVPFFWNSIVDKLNKYNDESQKSRVEFAKYGQKKFRKSFLI